MKQVLIDYDEYQEMVKNIKSYVGEIEYLKKQIQKLQYLRDDIALVTITETKNNLNETTDIKVLIEYDGNNEILKKTVDYDSMKTKLTADNKMLSTLTLQQEKKINYLESIIQQYKIKERIHI